MTNKILRPFFLAAFGATLIFTASSHAAIAPAENLLPSDTLGFFTVPDLHATFAEERGSDVVEADTRDLVFWEKVGMHHTRSPSLRQGSTQSSSGNFIGRAVFRPTAWFLPSVITGPDGVAAV